MKDLMQKNDASENNSAVVIISKCPLRGHILAPLEGLDARELPGGNPGDRLQESGGDSKAI